MEYASVKYEEKDNKSFVHFEMDGEVRSVDFAHKGDAMEFMGQLQVYGRLRNADVVAPIARSA